MTTKLTLYNGALRVLKQRSLATLTDSVVSRRLLDEVYDDAVQSCLEAGLWNFAIRTGSITASDTIDPAFGYSYGIEQPQDFVRLVRIADNEAFYPTLNEYVDEAGVWYTNVDPLYISYVSNDTDYGLDLSRWPQSFVRAVHHDLAVQIAPPLTNMGATEFVALTKEAARLMKDARSKDAANQPVERPPPGRLVMARMGHRTDQRRENS